jgi:broad specificity phosphatase PhoE
MTELYLICPAAFTFDLNSIATNKPEGRVLLDPPLSEEGKIQAVRLKERLLNSREVEPELLVSSPLLRARQSAEILNQAFQLTINYLDEFEDWRCVDGLEITGEIFLKQILALPPERRPFYSAAPGFESWVDFTRRIGTALDRLVGENEGKKIVLISHGHVLEATFLYCFGLNPFAPYPVMMNLDPAPTAITHWRKMSLPTFKAWRLLSYNDHFHLRPEFGLKAKGS